MAKTIRGATCMTTAAATAAAAAATAAVLASTSAETGFLSLTRVTKSYLSALGTTQISSGF